MIDDRPAVGRDRRVPVVGRAVGQVGQRARGEVDHDDLPVSSPAMAATSRLPSAEAAGV